MSSISIADQVQANLLAYFRLFAGLPGITFVDTDLSWLVNARGEPGNHVLRAQLPSAGIEQRIDELFAQVGQHSDHIDWLVFPGCRPEDIGQHLEARGMPGGAGGIWMLAELATLPSAPPDPPHFRAIPVRDDAALAAWAQISAEGFGGDTQIFYEAYARHGYGPSANALHFIGYLDDQPVTSSTLLLAGGIAGIFDVSTPPQLRGRGFGSAITRAAVEAAQQRGYRHAWIWASALGKPVYARLGFAATDLGVREYQWRRP